MFSMIKNLINKLIVKFQWARKESHNINPSQKNSGGTNNQTVNIGDSSREKFGKK